MALALTLTIAGAVGPDITRLLANGTEVALGAGGTYEASVPVVNGVVTLVSLAATGAESVRTIQVTTTGSVAG